MGPAKYKPARNEPKMKSLLKKYGNKEYLRKLIFDPQCMAVACWGLLIFEFFLNVFIIERIKYTEIDWIAYMQEVEGFLNGTLDYKELKGDTGPLVYPAGFVYIYSIFYYITSHGQNIHLAQYIFLVIYLLQLYFTFEIFKRTCKIPPYALVLSTITSYRIHSIYVLRLFNDPIAVLLFYVSLNMFLRNKWPLGSLFFSLAVSVKMNILLYAPCLLVAYLTNLTYSKTALNLFICGFVQLVLGAPFLYGNFWAYVKGSFDLGRVFEHKWTVNYRFLDRDVFENKAFHISLLAVHMLLLIMFLPYVKKYLRSYATLHAVVSDLKTQKSKKADKKKLKKEELSGDQERFLRSFESSLQNSGAKQQKNLKQQQEKETYEVNFGTIAQLFVLPFFVTNFIGVACARSLHYQFYSWYFNSLIYLVHCTPYRKSVVYLVLGVIEFCWNAYPSTNVSSALLHLSHIVLLYGIYKNMRTYVFFFLKCSLLLHNALQRS